MQQKQQKKEHEERQDDMVNYGPKKSPKTTIFPDALFLHFPWDLPTFFRHGVPFHTPQKALFHKKSYSKSPNHASEKVLTNETPGKKKLVTGWFQRHHRHTPAPVHQRGKRESIHPNASTESVSMGCKLIESANFLRILFAIKKYLDDQQQGNLFLEHRKRETKTSSLDWFSNESLLRASLGSFNLHMWEIRQ